MRMSILCFLVLVLAQVACIKHRAHVTAVPLSPGNQCEPEGIPYYLPKPLLVVAKNVRHIDEAKVGLTKSAPIPNGFDNQASYADVKANVTVPGSGDAGLPAANIGATALTSNFDTNLANDIPSATEHMTPAGRMEDGIAPDSFFTYQIVFVPDLTQKYGLRISGGPGEIRAAMNLVNGWMYTGMGPYYMKNSSTAQNLMSLGVGSLFAGRGVADVLNEVSDLARIASTPTGGGERAQKNGPDASEISRELMEIREVLKTQQRTPTKMLNYAEVHVYEPHLTPDGRMEWSLIAGHSFDREYFQPDMDDNTKAILQTILGRAPKNTTVSSDVKPSKDGGVERGQRDQNPQLDGNKTPDELKQKSKAQGDAEPLPSKVTPAPSTNPSVENNVDVNIGRTNEPIFKQGIRIPALKFGAMKRGKITTVMKKEFESLPKEDLTNSSANFIKSPGRSVESK